MKATAYSTRAFWARRTHPVLPVREIKLTLPLMLFAVIVLGFFFTMMHLQVRKSHYCQLIQRQSERVESLRGEVQALNSRLATVSALAAIRQRALARGMVEPDQRPQHLLVSFTAGELDRMGGAEAREVTDLLVRRWDSESLQPPGGEGRQ